MNTAHLTASILLAAALSSPASAQVNDTVCADAGDGVVAALEQIAEKLPACEADPHGENLSCAVILWLASVLSANDIPDTVKACADGGYSLGDQGYRIGGLIERVMPRMGAVAKTLAE